MNKNLWIVIIFVVGFTGFMMGYSVPPFLEVGFGDNRAPNEVTWRDLLEVILSMEAQRSLAGNKTPAVN